MLLLAFDTATDVATSALVDDGKVLGERISVARTLLEDVDVLLRDAHVGPETWTHSSSAPGLGASRARGSGLRSPTVLRCALDVPAAGVSTLDALATARDGAFPVVDARRREVFVLGPHVSAPDDLELEPGITCIGSGAVRYRTTFEDRGAVVPPNNDAIHVPHARLHAALARDFGPAEALTPLYVRSPDAKVPSSA